MRKVGPVVRSNLTFQVALRRCISELGIILSTAIYLQKARLDISLD